MSKKQHYDYDFGVIGSGFGGSVSALRLAEKGYKVVVLEKGKRYQTEDFPKTNWALRKSLWMPRLGLYGIQMLSLFKHVFIIHGGGVGGGSLVYANQLLIPPDEVFKKPEWGPGDWKAKLGACYDIAKKMLGATPCPSVGKADELLREVGIELRGQDTFHINDVGVFFDKPGITVPDPYFNGAGPKRTGCTLCGACMIGCPVGAKNTLDKNYLYLAERLGVKILSETEVLGVEPWQEGYQITTRKSIGLFHSKQTLRMRSVVFSAGVLGTVKLLMECKQRGQLPHISEQLGNYVHTNSESILSVNSSEKNANWNDHIAITSGIYADDKTHIELVRYNKGSDVLFGLTNVLTDGGGRIPRQLRFMGNVIRHPRQFLRSLWIPGQAQRSTAVLVMQTSENHMRFNYKRRWYRLGRHSMNSEVPAGLDRVVSYIPIANEVARRLAKKVKGYPKSTLSEILLDAPTTAHILGGCNMAATPAEGVVSFNGEIFGHPNLYIADGSVIPVNLGVNPSLTITALSEYIMSQMPTKAAKNWA